MAKNENGKKNGRNDKNEKKNSSGLKTHTKHGIIAVVLFVFALFFLMSAFSLGGVAGNFAYEKFYYLLGVGYILLPILLLNSQLTTRVAGYFGQPTSNRITWASFFLMVTMKSFPKPKFSILVIVFSLSRSTTRQS